MAFTFTLNVTQASSGGNVCINAADFGSSATPVKVTAIPTATIKVNGRFDMAWRLSCGAKFVPSNWCLTAEVRQNLTAFLRSNMDSSTAMRQGPNRETIDLRH